MEELLNILAEIKDDVDFETEDKLIDELVDEIEKSF